MGPQLIGKLRRCVYGCRDAGMLWEECYAQRMVEMGFVRGLSSPVCFHHPEKQLMAVVHGDDFTLLGTKANLDWADRGLAKSFELKLRGRLCSRAGCAKEMRILNRIARLRKDAVGYEPRPA